MKTLQTAPLLLPCSALHRATKVPHETGIASCRTVQDLCLLLCVILALAMRASQRVSLPYILLSEHHWLDSVCDAH